MDKRKNDTGFDWYTFLALWIAVGGAVALLDILLSSVLPHTLPIEFLQSSVGSIAYGVGMAFLSGALVGLAQQALLMYHWDIPVIQWWWVTAAGYALAQFISVMILSTIVDNVPTANISQSTSLLIFILVTGAVGIVPAILQATVLQRYIDDMWQYVFAFVIGGIITVALMPLLTMAISKLVFGAVTGATLLWLANNTSDIPQVNTDSMTYS